MKHLILLVSFIFSLGVSAESITKDWIPIEGFYATPDISQRSNITASIMLGGNGKRNIYFVMPYPGCENHQPHIFSKSFISVNGQAINTSVQCIRKGIALSFVNNLAGFKYLFFTFSNNQKVKINFNEGSSATYSAAGFKQAWAIMGTKSQEF